MFGDDAGDGDDLMTLRGLITDLDKCELVRLMNEIADQQPVMTETEREFMRKIWMRFQPTTAPELEEVKRIHSRIKRNESGGKHERDIESFN